MIKRLTPWQLRHCAPAKLHLTRHHGKTAVPCSPGPRRFHRSIPRQDVGLEGNAVNHADDVGDFLARCADAVHGLHHLGHHLAALHATPEALCANWFKLRVRCRRLAHGGTQPSHRGSGFSSALAWLSVRLDRSCCSLGNLLLAVATASLFPGARATTWARLSRIICIVASKLVVSPGATAPAPPGCPRQFHAQSLQRYSGSPPSWRVIEAGKKPLAPTRVESKAITSISRLVLLAMSSAVRCRFHQLLLEGHHAFNRRNRLLAALAGWAGKHRIAPIPSPPNRRPWPGRAGYIRPARIFGTLEIGFCPRATGSTAPAAQQLGTLCAQPVIRCFSASMVACMVARVQRQHHVAHSVGLAVEVVNDLVGTTLTLTMRSSTSKVASALARASYTQATKAIATPSTMTRAKPNPMAVPTFTRERAEEGETEEVEEVINDGLAEREGTTKVAPHRQRRD